MKTLKFKLAAATIYTVLIGGLLAIAYYFFFVWSGQMVAGI